MATRTRASWRSFGVAGLWTSCARRAETAAATFRKFGFSCHAGSAVIQPTSRPGPSSTANSPRFLLIEPRQKRPDSILG